MKSARPANSNLSHEGSMTPAYSATHPRRLSPHRQAMPPPVPIDPALTLYPPYYQNFQAPPPAHLPHHLALAQNYSSPSSQGSDTLGTPPTEHNYPSPNNANGKRPASVLSSSHGDSHKKLRKEEDEDAPSPKDEPKAKSTRGSRSLASPASDLA
jgi:hypothetical protein